MTRSLVRFSLARERPVDTVPLADILHVQRAMNPTLHFDGDVLPAATFHQRCLASAAALLELGVVPGDAVALMLYNEPLMLELMLATRWIGADYCMVNWHFKSDEVRHILADSEATVFVAHANLAQQILDGIPAGVRTFVAAPLDGTRRAFALDAVVTVQGGFETWEALR